MKIWSQRLTFDAANKTASVVKDHRSESREYLTRLAVSLVKTDGTVKSGYLKLKVGEEVATLRGNHLGGGATAATDLIKNMVQDAYGNQARQALDRYLAGKGKDKIGTLSFVKLIKRMEEDYGGIAGQAQELAATKGLEQGSIAVKGLTSRPKQEMLAAAAATRAVSAAQTFLKDRPSAANPELLLTTATERLTRLNEAISKAQALKVRLPSDTLEVCLQLRELTEQLETQVKKRALLESADRVAQDPEIQNLQTQLRNATAQCDGLFEEHQTLSDGALQSSSSADFKGVMEKSRILRGQIQSAVNQAQALSDQLREAATAGLIRANDSWCSTDDSGNPQFNLALPDGKKLEIAEAFNAARNQVIQANSGPGEVRGVQTGIQERIKNFDAQVKLLELLESADPVAQDPEVQKLQTQLRNATAQIQVLFAEHQQLAGGGLQSTTPADLKNAIARTTALRGQIESLTSQVQTLSDQVRVAATAGLVRANDSWCSTDASGAVQFKLELPPDKERDFAAAFNTARDQVIRRSSAPGEAARQGLAHIEPQMTAMQQRLQERADLLAHASSGQELGRHILGVMTKLDAALHDALVRRGRLEETAFKGQSDSSTIRTDLTKVLTSESPSSEARAKPEQLQALRDADAQVQSARQQGLERIGAMRDTIKALEEGSLSATDRRVLQGALEGWDRRIRSASTDIGWEASSLGIVKQFAKPVAPESVQALGSAWGLARGNRRMGVHDPNSGTTLLPTGAGEDTVGLYDTDVMNWKEVSPTETLSYMKSPYGPERAVVLSAGMKAQESYVAAGGRRDDLSAYSVRFQNLVKSREVFPSAPWQPDLLGFCGDDQGLKLIMEEIAPTNLAGVRLENVLVGQKSPPQKARAVMSTYIADTAACMADLHEQRWRMTDDLALSKNYFGVSPEGRLKLLKPIAPGTDRNRASNVTSLAHALIGSMGTLGPDSVKYLRQRTVESKGELFEGFLYDPDSDETAFELKVRSILTPAIQEEDAEDELQVFESDPAARQRVYAGLGLQAYGDWIERALDPESASSPATARELANLISVNEPEAGSETARRGLYSAAKQTFHAQYANRLE